MQYPRHLHSKGYKVTGLSQGLNSCRTSKRGIADKPQCPSNSFRLQILIAFTIESGKSSAYFILLVLIFLLEQSLYFCEAMLVELFKVCPLGKARMEKKVPSTLCLLSFSPPPEIRFTQTALTNPFRTHSTMFHVPVLRRLNAPK